MLWERMGAAFTHSEDMSHPLNCRLQHDDPLFGHKSHTMFTRK